MATKYVAPLLIGFGVLSAVAGCWAQYKRRSAWARIKAESNPVQAVAIATEMVVKSDDVRATEVVTAARQVRAEK